MKDAISVTLHVAEISKHHSDFSDLDEVIEVPDMKGAEQIPRYIITITRKSDGSVVRVVKAVHYFIDYDCEIPNISVLYEDPDGNYRTGFYPLVLFDFEILDI